jgi:GNAT superfamily N-acetyltransferase
MISFQVEPLAQCWDEVTVLTKAHWFETMQWQHGKQPYNPLLERYEAYDRAGWFLCFTARDAGKMVGYAWIYLVPSMHTQCLIAREDAIFLLPEYRGRGSLALRFFTFVEQEIVKRGAVEFIATAQPGTAAAKLLEHLGCTVVNLQYSKHLGRADSASSQPVSEQSNVCTRSAASA